MNDDKKEALIEMFLENFETGLSDYQNNLRRDYALDLLLREEFDLDMMKVSNNDIQPSFWNLMLDLSAERRGSGDYEHTETDVSIEDDGLVRAFQERTSDVLESIMRAEPITFTFYFPWNVSFGSTDSFSETGVRVKQIERSGWNFVVDQFIDEPDVSNTHVVEDRVSDGEFTFWKAEVSARGPDYAFSRVLQALRLICAKLNYSIYQYNTNHESDRFGIRSYHVPSGTRWSEIRIPFAYLLKDRDGPHYTAIIDDDDRRMVDTTNPEKDWEDTYGSIPDFSTGQSKILTLLEDVLITYQSAIEADSTIDAFFKFWRMLEELTQAQRGNKSVVTDRAMVANDLMNKPRWDPLFEDVVEELGDVRNKWVHQAQWKRVLPHHEKTAKYLTDTVLAFYFEYLLDTELEYVDDVFRYATMADSDKRNKERALETLRSIESNQ